MVFFADLIFSADKAAQVAEACRKWHEQAGETQAAVVAITCAEQVHSWSFVALRSSSLIMNTVAADDHRPLLQQLEQGR